MTRRTTLRNGRYTLLAPLASGGIATVWRAWDHQLDVARAVKVLDGGGAAPELHARFAREARVLAALEHPHVVPIHDAGADDGDPWLVMSLLPRSLADRVASEGPLPWPEAVRVAAQVVDALAAAHAAGVVHRDLKPHNVLLDADGGARLADFGVARAPDPALGTATDEVLGTWAYMAPEQRLGAGHVDARTDIYAVGVLLVAIGTRRPPGDLLVADARAALLASMPPPIAAVVDRCTRFAPEDRYPSAEALGAALRCGARPRPRPWLGWALLALGAGAAALTASLAAGVAGVAVARHHSRPEPPPASAPALADRDVPAPDVAAPEVAARDIAPEVAAAEDDVGAVEAPPPPARRVPARIAVQGAAYTVEIDGEARGTTPWTGTVVAGRRDLVLRALTGEPAHRRPWDPRQSPTLCVISGTWEPCGR